MPSTRRHFLRSVSLLTLAARAQDAPQVLVGKPPRGIRIEKVGFEYEDFKYRAPYKFGGTAVDRVTLLNVTVEVSTPAAARELRTKRPNGSSPTRETQPVRCPSRVSPIATLTSAPARTRL